MENGTKENNDKYIIHTSLDNEQAELLKLKCSNCGASLELLDKTHARCPFCQQEYRIDEAKGAVINVSIDYSDTEKVQKTLHSTKRTMIIFLCVVASIAAIVLVVNIAANSSVFSSSDRDAAFEENGELLVIFCKDIFGKEYKDISKEELESIKYIRYDSDRDVNDGFHVVEYSFTDYADCQDEEEFQDTIKRWTYMSSKASWPSDFTMFTGLTRIDTTNSLWLSQVEFSEKAPISYVETDNQLEVVTSHFNPENIKVLHMGMSMDSLEGIEAYKNLEELEIDYPGGRMGSTLDVTGIGACTKLKKLWLSCASDYTGLEELEELSQIKSISISGIELKDSSFLKEMTELEELYIMSGESGDLSMLSCLPKLKRLYFTDNGAVDTRSLQVLPELEELELTVEDEENLQGLVELSNLKSLDLYISIWTGWEDPPIDVSVLSELPCLEKLVIKDSTHGDITGMEGIFNKPTMKSLFIGNDITISSEMKVVLNPELLTDNPSLETLKMSGWKTSVDSKTLEENYDILAHYPNLKKLAMAECELKDIAFIASLPNLEIVNLQGNELTDYTPLQSLKKLKKVYVYGNPQTQTGLPEHVEVITEWEPDERVIVK